MMIEFQCDYAEGAHPKILERLVETNMDQTPGYGLDPYCDEARRLIRKACGREDIDVQFLDGGTQTNTTIICMRKCVWKRESMCFVKRHLL